MRRFCFLGKTAAGWLRRPRRSSGARLGEVASSATRRRSHLQAVLFTVVFWLGALCVLQAHELQPAYLELQQTGAESWHVLWKLPARADLKDAIRPKLPENCKPTAEPVTARVGADSVERFSITAPGGIDNRVIAVEGPAAAIADVLVRIVRLDGSIQIFRLTPTSLSHVVEPLPSRWQQAATYLHLGIEHILKGVDHLLFVLGLLLIVRDRWMLLKTVTAFTVAHSITLAIATLGYATAPLPPLNAAIALSILFLGPEMMRAKHGETSLTIRQPWVVAFAFGLLHGFGFASGLTSLGLSRGEIPLALLLFNVGVEIGQLFFILLIVSLERSFRILEIRWPRWAESAPAYTVGSLGAYWTIQRTAMMFAG